MANRKRIKFKDLGRVLPELIAEAAGHNAEIVAAAIGEWPTRFERRAKAFYPSVLKRPTGRLFRSISPFARAVDEDRIALGLRSDVDYAGPLHEGVHKKVNVAAHVVKRHKVSRHTDSRGRSIKTHQRGPFTRKAHSRQMDIEARYFFKIPIQRETVGAVNDLAEAIGWP